ncbi:hypothetical protein ASPBRDRAFT_42318 [Aspergillus brasiliensis CBS 101740]|uniref:Uncharacterized protein n=1 Tax=Aspergillus brasiliensis (strain CBS 101740 / IMI 381727 / IBT 21946) TaxID=767769 RepID=A0A1L9ULL2_ASPBC|nr:hypothetical protein ASPBRDRAFT_42318 [Aspergillus brasiliensis CBS 101740]
MLPNHDRPTISLPTNKRRTDDFSPLLPTFAAGQWIVLEQILLVDKNDILLANWRRWGDNNASIISDEDPKLEV